MTENLKPHPPTFPDRCGNTREQKDPLPGFPRYNPGAYVACQKFLCPREPSNGVAEGGGSAEGPEAMS